MRAVVAAMMAATVVPTAVVPTAVVRTSRGGRSGSSSRSRSGGRGLSNGGERAESGRKRKHELLHEKIDKGENVIQTYPTYMKII